MFSIIETAKENNLDPYEYLRYVFTKAPNLEESESIDILLPWNTPGACRSKSAPSTE
ncbi:MAG: transposase domain-containing protein [Ruminococcus sp.]|nr:transposase domain-containing protein [Ruminococcus sp.]